MIETVRNAWKVPELRKKIMFTIFALLIFRLGSAVPVPYIDSTTLETYLAAQSGTILGLMNAMSGSAFSMATVFALSIQPYINASIIIQLLTVAIPALERLAKEGGEEGRKKIASITRYTTVAIGLIQGFGYYSLNTSYGLVATEGLPALWVGIVIVLSFTAGSAFLMWLGEQSTEFGIGNGISLIIFCGIVVGIPRGIMQSMDLIKSGSMSIFLAVIIVLLMAAVLTAIVFVERAQRRIPISYAKRQIGRKMFGGQNTHLPLRVNTAGVIPPIFASSLLLFPATVGQFSTNEYVRMVTDFFAPHGVLYNVLYVVLIFFFCYFYTAIIIDPKDMAENLKKNGGFVPGIRPGERTQEYIDTVLSRLTLSGAVYISAISLLPMLMIAKFNVPFYFGGTSLLILVGVAMDFMNQVESHMISTQYQGLMNKAARKGGRIVTMSSVSGVTGNRGQTNYSAAKAGLIGASKALAVELAKRRITVNCVAPGLIDTGMVDMNEIAREHAMTMIPMQRIGTPEEVAAVVGFLMDERASYITRQVINVNGGMI